ncbi:MAG TPA: DNA cytosine methyltransferase [Candidatus Thermoplasmatota archaeon]|nr:DNA cytosine methyltransferase [Candidatus Thermoplasmatota archaeon]
MTYTVVDLFCGGGGFSRGFTQAGFRVTHAVEVEKPHAEAHHLNFPEALTLNADIRQVASLDAAPDVLIGGPPCEAYTGANAKRHPDPLGRLYEDPHGRLVLEYIRLLGQLKPRVFVMENVPGVADGPLAEALRKEFAAAGFSHVWFNRLRAEDFGTPSRRERMFVSNLPLGGKPQKRKIKVEEALEGLPPPGDALPNHEPLALTPEKQAKIARVPPGGSLYQYKSAGGRGLANWARLYLDQLAPPVMGRSRFIHPVENRPLTVRENARLMGFPDEHVFAGGRDSQFDQVGEAVPPPLACAIARDVLSFLDATGARPRSALQG